MDLKNIKISADKI